jgi:hypothetical protein
MERHRRMMMIDPATRPTDEAIHKGAIEDDGRNAKSVNSLTGQLGHRDQDEMVKDNDTDFPEPDAAAEISGK